MATNSRGTKAAATANAEAQGPAWYWTWTGASFGYREGNSLFTYDGVEVGRFHGREVYGADGRYLGESGSGDDQFRLITNIHKRSLFKDAFVPTLGRSHRSKAPRVPAELYSGHSDFPEPASLSTREGGRSYATSAGAYHRGTRP